jgi:hypothetical protein
MIAGSDRHLALQVLLRFDSPDDVFGRAHRLGAKAKASAPAYQPPGGFAVNARVERKYVMGRMNWSRIATRDLMRRYGVEDVKGKMPFVAEPRKPQPRRKLSEAELRQQAAAAFLAWRAGQTTKNK